MTGKHQHDNLLRGHVKLRSKLYNTDLSISHSMVIHGMVFRRHPSMTLCLDRYSDRQDFVFIKKNIAVKKKKTELCLFTSKK